MMLLSNPQLSRSWYMLGLLLVAQIFIAFIGRGISPLGPLFEADFQLSKWQVGLLPSALFFGQLLINIPAGHLTDRIGSRLMLLFVCLCLGSSFVFITFTHNFYAVLLFAIVAGIGYGAMHPTSNRGIMYWFDANRRGTAMGIKQMGITAGSMLAVLILLPLSIQWGWRVAVLVSSLTLCLMGFIFYILYRDAESSNQDRSTRHAFWSSMRSMIHNKALLGVSVATMGINGAYFSFNTYIVFYAFEELYLSLIVAGSFLIYSEAGGSAGRVGWGMISDFLFKGNRFIVLLLISIISAICSVSVAFIPAGTSLFWLIPFMIFFGFSVAGFNGIWMNLATEVVPKKDAGIASGFSITIGSLGAIIFPPMFGLIVDTTGSYTPAWFFLTSILIIVILLIWRTMHVLKKKPIFD